jgi:poly(3-hydroxyalkanoate) depolymerase
MTAEPAVAMATDRIRTISVRGIPARVSVRPASGELADEPPLLLCNGIGVSLEALQPLVDHLDPRRGVVRFDVPGVGGTPPPALPYPIAALSSWVTALMAKLGHRRFDVLGLSWGGGLTQQLALQSPRRVRSVVLVATGTGALMVPAHPRVLAKMSTPRRHRDPAYAARIANLLHATTRSGPKRGYYFQLAAMAGWSSLPFLGLIRQPTLVMGGDDDPIIPAANPRMQARLIPHARLHLYHGGHLGVLTESDELVPVIEEFLAEQRSVEHPEERKTHE